MGNTTAIRNAPKHDIENSQQTWEFSSRPEGGGDEAGERGATQHRRPLRRARLPQQLLDLQDTTDKLYDMSGRTAFSSCSVNHILLPPVQLGCVGLRRQRGAAELAAPHQSG
jgi:hypothetical protein